MCDGGRKNPLPCPAYPGLRHEGLMTLTRVSPFHLGAERCTTIVEGSRLDDYSLAHGRA